MGKNVASAKANINKATWLLGLCEYDSTHAFKLRAHLNNIKFLKKEPTPVEGKKKGKK